MRSSERVRCRTASGSERMLALNIAVRKLIQDYPIQRARSIRSLPLAVLQMSFACRFLLRINQC